ncbi:MAG: hypothetical protein RL095_2473 [Verrucomicrobiota bacterium]
MSETWIDIKAYGEKFVYRIQPKSVSSYSLFQRLLAQLCFNPAEEIDYEWRLDGETSLEAIIEDIKRDLVNDDDIAQQWLPGDKIMKLLTSAKDYEAMLDVIRIICGEYEEDSRLRTIAETALEEKL